MTEAHKPGHTPVGHVIFRVLLGILVVLLIAAAVVLAVLHHTSELTVGRNVWGSVKKWALPW
jgi:hypothetical protein